MKIILSRLKPQCQHVESGQCANCKNFRSKESLKKGLQDKPFQVLSMFVNSDSIARNDKFILPKNVRIFNRSGFQHVQFS